MSKTKQIVVMVTEEMNGHIQEVRAALEGSSGLTLSTSAVVRALIQAGIKSLLEKKRRRGRI